jgi:hypothetical protein
MATPGRFRPLYISVLVVLGAFAFVTVTFWFVEPIGLADEHLSPPRERSDPPRPTSSQPALADDRK